MNKERLLDLADKLEDLDARNLMNFDIISIVAGILPINSNELQKRLLIKDCGTTACAVGYLPIFYPDIFEYNGLSITYRDSYNIKYSGAVDCSTNYFELDYDEWDYLFEPKYYYSSDRKSPSAVADHIRRLVETGDVEELPEANF